MQYLMSSDDAKLKGVYKITNTINGDCYIGSTTRTFHIRYSNYKSSYKRYKEGNTRAFHPYLFNAFNKYGYENFTFEIVEYSEGTEKEVRLLEEQYIKELKPVYNICQRPSRGGSPNSGRKLTQEWKDRIGKKAKLYKHSDNKETYERIAKKNKDTSSIYKVWRNGEEFTGSLIDCSKFVNKDPALLFKWINGNYNSKEGWHIEKLKPQKKSIKVKIENKEETFNSYGECDRYFNMWRGYTSTKTLRGELLMDKYEYEIL